MRSGSTLLFSRRRQAQTGVLTSPGRGTSFTVDQDPGLGLSAQLLCLPPQHSTALPQGAQRSNLQKSVYL